ncbi:MAG: PilZ domain-containing protein [Acidobacteria bacterium]|nr:PilZ domain-containing protein [Acidobacteriota bacterium]
MTRKETVTTAAGTQVVEDIRTAKRYVFATPLEAEIGGDSVVLVDISTGGMGIVNTTHLNVGSPVRISVLDPDFGQRHKFRADVVWSRMTGEKDATGKLFYRTGLRFDQPIEEIAGILGRLIRFHGREDAESFDRKKKAVAIRMIERARAGIQGAQAIDSDTLMLVEQAMRSLAELSDSQDLLADARGEMEKRGVTGSHSREVLILWRMLDYTVSLESITRARAAVEAIRKSGG